MSRIEKAGYPLIGYFCQQQRLCRGPAKTPKDLAGKRVAVTQVGSSFHYSLPGCCSATNTASSSRT